MPKIEASSSVAITQSDIQEQINKIEYLLEGRIDDHNIFRDGDYIIPMSGKKVVDLPDSTRPISGNKFFASDVDGRVFKPLIRLMQNNRNFITMSGRASILMSKDTGTPAETVEVRIEKVDELRRSMQGDNGRGRAWEIDTKGFKKPEPEKKQGSIYTRFITLKKPPHIQAITWQKARSLFGKGISYYLAKDRAEELCIMPSVLHYKGDTNNSPKAKINWYVTSNTPEDITIQLDLDMGTIAKDEYVTIDFEVKVLCEVRV